MNKTIILNASPRKNGTTAKMLQSAAKGAESVGAEVEFVNLYDLNFVGCHSCFACKRKDSIPRHCYWKDDFSPLLDRMFEARAIIMGSPVYVMDTTSQFHAVIERLVFTNIGYGHHFEEFKGSINFGAIYTMNAGMDYYKYAYEPKFKNQLQMISTLNGKIMMLPTCDTLHVSDLSKFDMDFFDERHKKYTQEHQLPQDMEAAFQMGAELSK